MCPSAGGLVGPPALHSHGAVGAPRPLRRRQLGPRVRGVGVLPGQV